MAALPPLELPASAEAVAEELPASPKPRAAGGAVVIFDFDQVLAVGETGLHDVRGDNVIERVFGGAERVKLIVDLLSYLHSHEILVSVVSRNSKHVVSKALGHSPGIDALGFVQGGVFGWEDYGCTTPKSQVIGCRILPRVGLRQASPHELRRRALFLDDNANNIGDVSVNCEISTLLVPRRSNAGGIRELEVQEVMAWVEVLEHGEDTSVWLPAAQAPSASHGLMPRSAFNLVGRTKRSPSLTGLDTLVDRLTGALKGDSPILRGRSNSASGGSSKSVLPKLTLGSPKLRMSAPASV